MTPKSTGLKIIALLKDAELIMRDIQSAKTMTERRVVATSFIVITQQLQTLTTQILDQTSGEKIEAVLKYFKDSVDELEIYTNNLPDEAISNKEAGKVVDLFNKFKPKVDA